MRFTTLLLSTLLCIALTASADEPTTLKADKPGAAETQIEKIERDWNHNLKEHKRAAISALCSEDFLFTDEHGKVQDKTQYLNDIESLKVASYTMSDLKIKVYGDTAIVNGKWKGKINDNEVEVSIRFTDTFVRRNNQWFVIASQDVQM
ncbi:MAG: nuclear transport factor 2 family protein [Armatimonadetes bacterium]|nr:nuclear transport factor 2 family protein [Armatimonadota bacterium]